MSCRDTQLESFAFTLGGMASARIGVEGMAPAQQKNMERYKALPSLDRLDHLFEIRGDTLYNRVGRPRAGRGLIAGALGDKGYMFVCVDYQKYKVHRIVWAIVNRSDPGQLIVDHIDRNKLNNSPDNLRLLTKRMNSLNANANSRNTSGVVGVYWYARERRWVARGKSYGKTIGLGYFKDKESAIDARLKWELEQWRQ